MKKLKKLTVFLIIFSFIMPIPSFGQAYETRVKFNDQYLTLETAPIHEGDQIFLPLRDTFLALGGQVSWEQSTQRIVVKIQGETLEFQSNSHVALKDGNSIQLADSILIHDGVSYMSSASFGGLFNYLIGYDTLADTLVIVDVMALLEEIEIENELVQEWMNLEDSNASVAISEFLALLEQGTLKIDLSIEGTGSMEGYEKQTYEGGLQATLEAMTNGESYSIEGAVDYFLNDLVYGLVVEEEASYGIVKAGDDLYNYTGNEDLWFKEKAGETGDAPTQFHEILEGSMMQYSTVPNLNENSYEMFASLIESMNQIYNRKEILKEQELVGGERLNKYSITFDKEDLLQIIKSAAPIFYENLDFYTLLQFQQISNSLDGSLEMVTYADQTGKIMKTNWKFDLQYTEMVTAQVLDFNFEIQTDYVSTETADTIETRINYLIATDERELLDGGIAFTLDMDIFSQVTLSEDTLLGEGGGSFMLDVKEEEETVNVEILVEVKLYLDNQEVVIEAPTGTILEQPELIGR